MSRTHSSCVSADLLSDSKSPVPTATSPRLAPDLALREPECGTDSAPPSSNDGIKYPNLPTTDKIGAARSIPSHRALTSAWTQQDDNILLRARATGLNWGKIQSIYFNNKTGNACRKRHQHLMSRKSDDDWEDRKLERLGKEYMSMRKELWTGLAQRVGEKWNIVEHKVRPHKSYIPQRLSNCVVLGKWFKESPVIRQSC